MAKGPAFKKNFTVDTFSLVDIYPLMCHILDIKPMPNNGSVEIINQLLINRIPVPGRANVYIEIIAVVLGLVVILVMCIWRRRRYLRLRLKQLTPGVTSVWPVTYTKVAVTESPGSQVPLVTTCSEQSDDEYIDNHVENTVY